RRARGPRREPAGRPLADDRSGPHPFVGPQEDHALTLAPGQHHALALDAAELRGLQVRDHHYLATDQRRGLVVRTDAGDQLTLLASPSDPQRSQTLRVRE